MDVKDFYEQIGGSYEDVIARLPMEKLIIKYLIKFINDPSFHNLQLSLEQNDQEAAFRASHTLKGTSGTLGMKRLMETSDHLTESLRNHDEKEKVETLFLCVKKEYDKVMDALKKFKESQEQ